MALFSYQDLFHAAGTQCDGRRFARRHRRGIYTSNLVSTEVAA